MLGLMSHVKNPSPTKVKLDFVLSLDLMGPETGIGPFPISGGKPTLLGWKSANFNQLSIFNFRRDGWSHGNFRFDFEDDRGCRKLDLFLGRLSSVLYCSFEDKCCRAMSYVAAPAHMRDTEGDRYRRKGGVLRQQVFKEKSKRI